MRNVRGTLTPAYVSHFTLENDRPKVVDTLVIVETCKYARVWGMHGMKHIKGYRLSQELVSQVNYSANGTGGG